MEVEEDGLPSISLNNLEYGLDRGEDTKPRYRYKTGIKRDTIWRCLDTLGERGIAENSPKGSWHLKPGFSHRIRELQELQTQLEDQSLDLNLLKTILKRIRDIYLNIREKDMAKNLTVRLEQFKENPEILSQILAIMSLCDFNHTLLDFQQIKNIVLENIKGQPKAGEDEFCYDDVLVFGLEILGKIPMKDKLNEFMDIFREALRVDRSTRGADARLLVLSLVTDEAHLLNKLTELSHKEQDRVVKSKLDKFLDHFSMFVQKQTLCESWDIARPDKFGHEGIRSESSETRKWLRKHSKDLIDEVLKCWFGSIVDAYIKERNRLGVDISHFIVTYTVTFNYDAEILGATKPILGAASYFSSKRSKKVEVWQPYIMDADLAMEHLHEGYPDVWDTWKEITKMTSDNLDKAIAIWDFIEAKVLNAISINSPSLVKKINQVQYGNVLDDIVWGLYTEIERKAREEISMKKEHRVIQEKNEHRWKVVVLHQLNEGTEQGKLIDDLNKIEFDQKVVEEIDSLLRENLKIQNKVVDFTKGIYKIIDDFEKADKNLRGTCYRCRDYIIRTASMRG